jgi:hypothetical protein
MEWLELEIDGIRERITQMDNKLEEVLHEVHQFNRKVLHQLKRV